MHLPGARAIVRKESGSRLKVGSEIRMQQKPGAELARPQVEGGWTESKAAGEGGWQS